MGGSRGVSSYAPSPGSILTGIVCGPVRMVDATMIGPDLWRQGFDIGFGKINWPPELMEPQRDIIHLIYPP